MKKTVVLLFAGLLVSCIPQSKPKTIPTVITGDITEITTTTATCSYEVTDTGGAEITAQGVCWSTSEDPTTENSKTEDDTGLGTYTSNISSLTPNTTYYVRAYATNSIGTAYGEQETFKTSEVPKTPPTVTTGGITDITTTTASCPCEVTDDGGTEITARGVCWCTSEGPTTADSKTEDGTGVGTYTSKIIGLDLITTYYARAYATNSEGTAYGEQKIFTTKDIEYGSLTDDRDNNEYKTIQISNQIWMAENLKYLPAVHEGYDGSRDSPRFYVYSYPDEGEPNVTDAKTTTNYLTYGVLYNWQAALIACPNGWHLPEYDEWIELFTYLSQNGYRYDGTPFIKGSKIYDKIAKSMGATTGWSNSDNPGVIGNTDYPENRNKSGFSGLPGGRRYNYSSGSNYFLDRKTSGYWWSATETSETEAWRIYIMNYTPNVSYSSSSKDMGFSVRCIKD